jgi:divalent metal cation (Fe/Co/Zn/Cd) transporter
MDAAPSAAVMARISELIASHGQGALEAHDLKTRATGRWNFLEFHLVVPGHITVAAAHDICDRIEHALMADMKDLVVTIHVEPASKAKHEGIIFDR